MRVEHPNDVKMALDVLASLALANPKQDRKAPSHEMTGIKLLERTR